MALNHPEEEHEDTKNNHATRRKTTLGWLEFESLVTQGFLRRCGDQFWCLRGWQARDHSSGDNEQIGGLASCAFGFPVWYTVGAYWYQSCLFPETFEELGVRLINNSCRWIVEMNVIHHGWQFESLWDSMPIWRCVWYSWSKRQCGKNCCRLQETDIADRRGKVRDWWFSGVALHHVPTWATSPRLHEGETMGAPDVLNRWNVYIFVW